MFQNWCDETGRMIIQQINKRKSRVKLYLSTDSEQNYVYLCDGTLHIESTKQFGYDIHYFQVYEEETSFVENSLSFFQTGQQKSQDIAKNKDSLRPPPIIKKLILPQCLFQINMNNHRMYFLQSEKYSRTAMLKFQSEYQTQIYWRLITWVLMRQNNSQVDPFRAFYLPNEKNLSFILDNFDKMKPRIFADITRFSHRFVEAIGVLIDKCIQVSDQFNLGKCHDLIERILYTEDNQMIESMFKNHNSFKVILTSFSRKRQQNLLSCYWDPILPLPIEQQCRISSLISQDFLHAVPKQVRQAICLIHRITYFRQFVLEIKKKLPFEARLMQIIKYTNQMLILYFTNSSIVKDMLIYDQEKWGLWKSEMIMGNEDKAEFKSDIYSSFSISEDSLSEMCQSQWDRLESEFNSSISHQTQTNIIQIQQKQIESHRKDRIQNHELIELEDDSNSGCQIIDKPVNSVKNPISLSPQEEDGVVVVPFKKTKIQEEKERVRKLQQERKIFLEDQARLIRSRMVKSFKPLLFWLIVSFCKSMQQNQNKQQAISALFNSDLIKYVFNNMNLWITQSNQTLSQQFYQDQRTFQTPSSHNSWFSSSPNYEYINFLTPKKFLFLQILVLMAKNNHKKMIVYLNSQSRKANNQENGLKKIMMEDRRKDCSKEIRRKFKELNSNGNQTVNPYKVLALSYWKLCSEQSRKVLLLIESLFQELNNEAYIQTFLQHFVTNCFAASIKYFTAEKIKQESVQRQSPVKTKEERIDAISMRQARIRQMQMTIFLMKSINSVKYYQFINNIMLKYILPTFSQLTCNQESVKNKEQTLLTLQFLNKTIDWIQFTKKERQKHERKQRSIEEDQSHVSSINQAQGPKPVNNSKQAQSSQPILLIEELNLLQKAIIMLEQELISRGLVIFMYKILLDELRRKKDNCIVSCGLQIMKKLKNLLARFRTLHHPNHQKNSNIYNDLSKPKLFPLTLGSSFSIHNSLLPLNKSHHGYAQNSSQPKLCPLLTYMFTILQHHPEYLLTIQQLALSHGQLFLTFQPIVPTSNQHLSISSSQQQSSSIDYSQSNESEISNDNVFFRFNNEDSNDSSNFSSESQEEKAHARMNHLLELQLDEMYNRREYENDSSDDDEEDVSDNSNTPQDQQHLENIYLLTDPENFSPNEDQSSSHSSSSTSSKSTGSDPNSPQIPKLTPNQSLNTLPDTNLQDLKKFSQKNNTKPSHSTPYLEDSSSSSSSSSSSEYSSSPEEQYDPQDIQRLLKKNQVQQQDIQAKMQKFDNLIKLFSVKQSRKQQSSSHQDANCVTHQHTIQSEQKDGQLEAQKAPYRTYFHPFSLNSLLQPQENLQEMRQNEFQQQSSNLCNQKAKELRTATQIEKETYAEQQMTLEAFTSYYRPSLDQTLSSDKNNKEKSEIQKSSRIFYKVNKTSIIPQKSQQPILLERTSKIQTEKDQNRNSVELPHQKLDQRHQNDVESLYQHEENFIKEQSTQKGRPKQVQSGERNHYEEQECKMESIYQFQKTPKDFTNPISEKQSQEESKQLEYPQ